MSSQPDSENFFLNALEPSIFNSIGENPFQELKSDEDDAFEGNLFLQQDPAEEIVIEHYFSLAKNYLICYKNSFKNEILYTINFNDIWKFYYDYEIYSTCSSADSEDDDPTYFLFLRSKESLHLLYCPNLSDYFQWVQKLRSRCVLSNFGNSYKQKLNGKLGGNFYLFSNAITQKEYLVNIFNLQKLQKPENKEFFMKLRNQIIIMKNVHHKNIINLVEIYEGKTNLYLVYENISGISLNFLPIQTLKSLEYNAIMNQKNQLINAIEYLHSKGITHKKVTPSCMFFKNQEFDSELILCNFQLIDLEGEGDEETNEENISEFVKIENIFQKILERYCRESNIRQ